MKFTNQIIEQLPPSQITAQLQERIEQLEKLLAIKEKALKKAPEGSLRVSKSHGAVQYYQKINKDEKNGRYLDTAHREVAQKLAQKAYNLKLVPVIKKELALLQAALTKIREISQGGEIPLNVLDQVNPDSRALITTATLTDAQYAAAWLSQKYKGKPFQPDAHELYAAGGIRVRSKSEVIIADTLTRLGIPYLYEFPLTLKSGGRGAGDPRTSRDANDFREFHGPSTGFRGAGDSRDTRNAGGKTTEPRAQSPGSRHSITVYPDFLCLNLRTRQEFIWEHFGLMDDPEYSEKFVQKIHTYGENGILPGKNLIFTTETEKEQLDTRNVEDLIKIFLK